IQPVRFQAAENPIHAFQNVIPGKIIPTGADAALALKNQLLPQPRVPAQNPAEQLLTGSLSVDVRMVPVVDSQVQLGLNEPFQLLLREASDSHTALDNGRDASAADAYLFHG